MKSTGIIAGPFDYSRLKAKTVECGYNDKDVARAGKMTPSTYSLKLNGKSAFTQEQIYNICVFLCINFADIPGYFFTLKV